MAVTMLVTTLPLVGIDLTPKAAAGMSLSSYKVGDIIQYGSYPQTKVTDSELISKLKAADGTWCSYGYMSGAGEDCYDGSAQPADYMKYKDVTVDGERYRAVKFSTYRKYYINYKSDTSTSYTYQAKNGYYINKTYWFKFETLDWRVLDPQLGLVMCENIIDSQPYSNTIYKYKKDTYGNTAYWKDAEHTIYANNYAESDIRAWLNNDFYYTAFSSSEQENIATATIDNKAYDSSVSAYDSAATSDKVFMLTYDDALNTDYGFSAINNDYDINRRAASSDYAKCQGLHVFNSASYNTADGQKTSLWWLRSAGRCSGYDSYVYESGRVGYYYYVYYSSIGVRPALILKPVADCTCKCHSSGFTLLIWKIGNFFHKLFKMDEYYECACGRHHW